MSSLSQQLKSIGEKNASVAVDRKSRQVVHGRSLLFEPVDAAAQDFEFIHQIGVEGLEELILIDSRFEKFSDSLFSDTSVSFDRNVATKDVLENLDQNIEAFMNLAAPYYSLSPALKAMEWLVRRYHVNIHNSENLLLFALAFHSQPVFTRYLRVLPKQNVPHIFLWIENYRNRTTNPPAASILKAFHDEPELFKLYSHYLVDQLRHRTIYKEQLVFYLSNTAQVVASQSRDLTKLNDAYIPVVIETVAALLTPQLKGFKFSSTLTSDIKLTAYAIISVLCSVVPLNNDLVFSLTKAILQDKSVFSTGLKRQTLIVLGQLWNFYNEEDVPSKANVFADLPFDTMLEQHSLIISLLEEKYYVSKLIFFYVVDALNKGEDKTLKLLEFVDVGSSSLFFDVIVKKILASSTGGKALSDQGRTSAVQIFELLLKSSKEKLVSLLESNGKTLADLEMILMHTLGESAAAYDGDLEDVSVEVDTEPKKNSLKDIKTTARSFLDKSSNPEFSSIYQALIGAIAEFDPQEYKQHFYGLSRSAFTGRQDEVFVSFLIRLAFTPAVPLPFRLLALAALKQTLESAKKSANLYLLAPIFLLGLADTQKSIRDSCITILKLINRSSNSGNKNLFMQSEIYSGSDELRKTIISPKDGKLLMDEIFSEDSAINDISMDAGRIERLLYKKVFKKPNGSKKHGQLFKNFVFGQWALPRLPLIFKTRVWKIVGDANVSRETEDRFSFFNDVKSYTKDQDKLSAESVASGLDFKEDVQQNLVHLVGGASANEKKLGQEIEWLLTALRSEGNLQVVADQRIKAIFPSLQSIDLKLKISGELINLLINDDDILLKFDPLDTLQSLNFSNAAMIALLGTVNIVTEVPQQSVAKRRRRSSSSTQKNMARDDINNMAATHLRKLAIILDVLESQLRHENASEIANADLLKTLFKILTDLDYLGNDGKLPILYAQETLASCMLHCIVEMKKSNKKKTNIDSNAIRADLIVNSIRHSQSPQVQNRLLLVIAELASLSPEIILHSVMPIFTFMGAHTVRQDDEFSSSALQQTISKVVPAITKSAGSISNETEFLLTSFVTAFQHIPRHRRVKLFVSLVDTLGQQNTLHIILYLIGLQYSTFLSNNKKDEQDSLMDFTTALMKTFDAAVCLESFEKLFELWSKIPDSPLNPDSEEHAALSARPIFGSSLVNSTSKELKTLKVNLLKFLNHVLSADEEFSASANLVSLKMKVSLVLFDDLVSEKQKQKITKLFNGVTSFILSSLDSYTNLEKRNLKISEELYSLLKSLLNLLPMSFYVSSIADSLKNVKDELSMNVAKNFALLAGTKFETELNASTFDDAIEATVLGKLLPILINGIRNYDNAELVQAYLDTFATIVNKLGAATPEIATSNDGKMIINSLKVVTSKSGLLSELTEVVVSSLSAIASVIRLFGVKCIGFFPQILTPSFEIWKSTTKAETDDSDNEEEKEAQMLVQGSVLMLLSTIVKKMPAFITSNLKQIISIILTSDLIDGDVRSNIMSLVVEHVDGSQVLQCLCNLALIDDFYSGDNAADLGLYLSAVRLTVDSVEKKVAISNSTLFMRWLIRSFEFRADCGEKKFNDNTIHSIENSFHQCGIAYVMKLNDKSFRPLFANLVRWAANGEGAMSKVNTEVTRVTAFFRFFNKLQDKLRSIITTYFSYLLDPTIALLTRFSSGDLKETNMRRIILHSLTSSFKFDQVDYWSHQSRFETIVDPLLAQLGNIEPSIGKYLVKAITSFITDVTSEEYNEKLVHGLIRYISNEHENSANTKIWTVRVLKEVFQKMGEQWLSFLPTFIPYIAELLEDDDEAVELEVRKDLVRVIENVLGEPLERYLS